MDISEEGNKVSIVDYDQELREIWHKNVKQLHSKVIVDKCEVIDNIRRQIYLNTTKRKSSLFDALLEP
jgi:hypothetical protein